MGKKAKIEWVYFAVGILSMLVLLMGGYIGYEHFFKGEKAIVETMTAAPENTTAPLKTSKDKVDDYLRTHDAPQAPATGSGTTTSQDSAGAGTASGQSNTNAGTSNSQDAVTSSAPAVIQCSDRHAAEGCNDGYCADGGRCIDVLNNGAHVCQCYWDAETNCGDGIDNDHDGQTDCADPSCDGVGGCCEWSCADTDGGVEYYVRGTATESCTEAVDEKTDECVGKYNIKEWYCKDSRLASMEKNCSEVRQYSWCMNGVCMTPV